MSATSFVTTVLLGRFAGAEELGLYSVGLSILLFFASAQESLVSLPYAVYVNREPSAGQSQYAGAVLAQQGLLAAFAGSSLALAGLIIAAQGDGRRSLAPVVFALSVMVPLFLLREFSRRMAFAELRMETALALDVAVAALQLTGLLVLYRLGRLSAIAGYMTIAAACGACAVTWLVLHRRHFSFNRQRTRREFTRHWIFGRWVMAGRLVALLNSDVLVLWVLGFLIGRGASGQFAACLSIVLFSNPLLLGLSNLVTPKVTRALARGGPPRMRRVVFRVTMLVGAAMSAFCIAVLVFGGDVMRLLYRGQYPGHEGVIVVLALGLLASSLGMGASNGLWAMERPDLNVRASLLGLIVTLVGALGLAIPLQMLGAAVGLLAGLATDSAMRWWFFLRLQRPTEGAA